MRKFFLLIGLLVTTMVGALCAQDYRNKIWYRTPADASVKDNPDGWVNDQEWLRALPVGNGFLGAMVFGDVNKERIQLNEMSLWSGSRQDSDNPDAAGYLNEIRQLLFVGKYKEATALTNKTQVCRGPGSSQGNGANGPFGCFQTLGDLWLDFKDKQAYEGYYRELDLINGITLTRFRQGGVRFTREVFASHPANAIVVRITADKPGAIHFLLSINRPERFMTITDNKRLVMTGALNNGRGGDGMKYKAIVTPVLTGGTVKGTGNTLEIEHATAVTLIITAKTNYRQSYPDFINNNYEKELAGITKKAVAQPYTVLRQEHVKDFSGFMNRVSFVLDNSANNIPTDELMQKTFHTKNGQVLYPLYFQFGRYLLLSASRPGGLPANLQGIWTNKIQTPWNGDYHTDINVQMNYWPAEVTNLSECHLPLISLIRSLKEPGKRTAKIQYHMNGWALHPITNVWGYTSPGEHASWGMHIGAGAWIAQHLWEHYAFTRDKKYLASVYPMLKEAGLLYLNWLVKDPVTGKLVSGPSASPENSFKAPDGSNAQISMGPAHDHQVIYNLFTNTLQADKELGYKEDDFLRGIAAALQNLAPPQIGKDGRLMEWAQEFEELEPTHRHLSHLFALYPGSEITPDKTPALAGAVQRSLETRGDEGVGWTYAWKIALWARLHNGDRAVKILNNQLRPTFDTSTKYSGGGGTYYNLFDACPPFQIDGNFGVIAGMAEMLLQSHEDFIELLPALPSSWQTGTIKGLVARGNFIVDMQWRHGRITSAQIRSAVGGTCRIKYGSKVTSVNVLSGKVVDLSAVVR